jgi:hypothetical protein
MAALESAKHESKALKKKEEDRKFLMQSLFAGIAVVKKVDAEGNCKYSF